VPSTSRHAGILDHRGPNPDGGIRDVSKRVPGLDGRASLALMPLAQSDWSGSIGPHLRREKVGSIIS
jgi:hypothetical protein